MGTKIKINRNITANATAYNPFFKFGVEPTTNICSAYIKGFVSV